MRVISTVPDKSVTKEIVCKHCGATLEYVPADIHRKIVRDYLGDSESSFHIVCPLCNHQTNVRPDKWVNL